MRLQRICGLIPKNVRVMDIGSDHAHLAIMLLKSKKASHVINIDKNKLPLENGISNLRKNGLLEKTTNIKNDGLKDLKQGIEVDYCVASGLGGGTIVSILKNNNSVKITNLITVPNNDAYSLRKYLICSLHHKIIHEEIVVESNVSYPIIVSKKWRFNSRPSYKNFLLGPVNIKNKKKNFIQYLTQRKEYLENSSVADVNKKMRKELRIISRYLKNCAKRKLNK